MDFIVNESGIFVNNSKVTNSTISQNKAAEQFSDDEIKKIADELTILKSKYIAAACALGMTTHLEAFQEASEALNKKDRHSTKAALNKLPGLALGLIKDLGLKILATVIAKNITG